MRGIGCLALGFAAALVFGGCGAPAIDNSTTLASLSAAGKGGLVVRIDMLDCSEATLVVGRKSGDTYQQTASIIQGDSYRTSGVAHVELDPGDYHVLQVACKSGRTTNVLGKLSLGTSEQSFGRFEVRAGEIVNIGLLKLIYMRPGVVHLAAGDIPEYEMSRFREQFPQLAAQMQTRLLVTPIPQLSDADMVKYCRHITEFNGSYKLPTHPACQHRHDENARRLDALDPGRPAIMQ